MEVLGYGTTDVRKQICIRYVLRQYNPNPVTVFQPFASLGTAVSTLASQNQGANNYKRIKTAVIRAEIITAVISAFFMVAILLFRANIISLFVDDRAVVELGSKGLMIAGSMYFALGTIYIMRGALNGMGDGF